MEVMNNSVNSVQNSSKVVDPVLTWQRVHPVSLRNGPTAAATHTAFSENSVTSGIVPAMIAATLFITFLLALYAVLWKCMVSPPQRKNKMRVRVHQKTTV